MPKNDGVAIVSGGLDSVTLMHDLVDRGLHPRILSFNYGQRHAKELKFAHTAAANLGLDWNLVPMAGIADLISSSALTFGHEVPEGHYAEDNMALTVVPNRNMMMLAIAGAIAVNDKLDYIAAGMHAGDHAQYPDCRVDFVYEFTQALITGNEGFINPAFAVHTPFIQKSKNDIARRAYELGLQPATTWSCYKGDLHHCGRCGTCVERLEAIDSVNDPDWDETVYADRQYWKQAVAEFQASK